MNQNNVIYITNRIRRVDNDTNKFNEIVDLKDWTVETLLENRCVKRFKVVPCGVVIFRYEDYYLNDPRKEYREKAIKAGDELCKLLTLLISEEKREISLREARQFGSNPGCLFSIGERRYSYNTNRGNPRIIFLCEQRILKGEFPVWIVLTNTSLEDKMKETLHEWVEWCQSDPDAEELLIDDLKKIDDKFFTFNMKLVTHNMEDLLVSFICSFYFRLGGRKGLHFVAFDCNEKEVRDYLEYLSTL